MQCSASCAFGPKTIKEVVSAQVSCQDRQFNQALHTSCAGMFPQKDVSCSARLAILLCFCVRSATIWRFSCRSKEHLNCFRT